MHGSTYDAQRPELAGGGGDDTEQSGDDHDGADSDRQQTRAGQHVVDRLVVSLHHHQPDAERQQDRADHLHRPTHPLLDTPPHASLNARVLFGSVSVTAAVTSGCPPVSRLIRERRLRFFGHAACADPKQD